MRLAPDRPGLMEGAMDVVVLCWNTAGWVLFLVEQLHHCSGWKRLVVVDNHSHANERRALRQFLRGEARLLELEMNLGVAGAWNEGLRHTTAPLVALLNTDLRIERLDCLVRAAERFAAEPRLGILSIADNEPPAWFRNGRIVRGSLTAPEHPVACDCVTGAAYVFRRELGGFDETFTPAYCEETDHCLRAREKGYRVVQCGLGIHHLSGGTLRSRFSDPETDALSQLLQQRLAAKWRGRWPVRGGAE